MRLHRYIAPISLLVYSVVSVAGEPSTSANIPKAVGDVLKQVVSVTVEPSTNIPKAVSDALEQLVKNGINPTSVAPAPIEGLYEIILKSEIFYVSADGRYAFIGDIRDIKTWDSLTDNKRSELRLNMINQLDESEMIVFAPEKETKHTVNVFTDVDCGYCAKFHKGVDELTAAGVKVRYLAFPRAGVGSNTYKEMVSVWCAEDQQQAMTDAKSGRTVKTATCDNPVKDQYELGQKNGCAWHAGTAFVKW